MASAVAVFSAGNCVIDPAHSLPCACITAFVWVSGADVIPRHDKRVQKVFYGCHGNILIDARVHHNLDKYLIFPPALHSRRDIRPLASGVRSMLGLGHRPSPFRYTDSRRRIRADHLVAKGFPSPPHIAVELFMRFLALSAFRFRHKSFAFPLAASIVPVTTAALNNAQTIAAVAAEALFRYILIETI